MTIRSFLEDIEIVNRMRADGAQRYTLIFDVGGSGKLLSARVEHIRIHQGSIFVCAEGKTLPCERRR